MSGHSDHARVLFRIGIVSVWRNIVEQKLQEGVLGGKAKNLKDVKKNVVTEA